MENASKALLIAGGILIAMLLLSLMVIAFASIRDFQDSQDSKKEAEQIAKFNTEYTAYNKTVMYGADVITVYGKAAENNIKYADNEDYKVTISIVCEDGSTLSNDDEVKSKREDYAFKTAIFKCTQIVYNPKTGRVSSMTFEQQTNGSKREE